MFTVDTFLCLKTPNRIGIKNVSRFWMWLAFQVMFASVVPQLPEASSIISLPSTSSAKSKKTTTLTVTTTPEAKTKPLISKSAVLRLLAELVKPYIGCAQFVSQYQFIVCSTPHAKEVSKAYRKCDFAKVD